MNHSPIHQRQASIVLALALAASSFCSCHHTVEPRDRTPISLPSYAIAGFEESRRSSAFSGAVAAEVWVEVIGAKDLAARAREEHWPLIEAPEQTLAGTASYWRDAMQRALFRSGVALADRPHAECWTLELRLQQLVPTDAWLNAIGAETLLAESGRVDVTLSLQDASGAVMLWCRRFTQEREAASRIEGQPWDDAARAVLRSAADQFAAELRPR